MIMGRTGLAVFDRTIQESNRWLKSLMKRLDTSDRDYAYKVLKATLHALRDRIGPETAVHLSAQLPILIRGVYFEGWHPAGTPTRERRLEDFLQRVREEIDLRGPAEDAVKAVFMVIWENIDQGEVAKLIRVFPAPLRALWQAPARPAGRDRRSGAERQGAPRRRSDGEGGEATMRTARPCVR
jgi:uncharacterized protein (DUF2267 family)